MLLAVILAFPLFLSAERPDTVINFKQPFHKNVIKFNPTPMLLWSMRNVTFSYERIINARQSASIEVGYLAMPKLFDDTIVHLVNITSHQKGGMNVTLEYRFYLTKLNSRPIPAGLYIGPYLTFYGYKFKNGLDILGIQGDNSGMLEGNFWSFNLGAELGYQFVFWKRFTLDLVMIGSSVSYYGGSVNISGDLDPEQIKLINEALYDKLMERFPALQYISVNKTYRQTGKLDIVKFGFRYLVQIGFHF